MLELVHSDRSVHILALVLGMALEIDAWGERGRNDGCS